jgi:hypothetical protein
MSSSSSSDVVRPPLLPTIIGMNHKTEQLPGYLAERGLNLKQNIQRKEQERGE